MRTLRHIDLAAGLVALAILLCATPPATAQTKVTVCVSFYGPRLKDPAEYQRLLASELRHHPTHQVVRRGCAAKLHVEYIQLQGSGVLTGRFRGGVPHRIKVKQVSAIPAALKEMVSFLLRREPVYLVENLATSGLLGRPKQSLLKQGRNFFGLELYQLLVWAKGTMSPLVGGALRFRRATDHLFVGARAEFAYRPTTLPPDLKGNLFEMYGAAQVEVGFYLLPDAMVTPYIGGLAGAAWYRVHGLVGPPGAEVKDDLTSALFTVSLRVGLELLRQTRTRLEIFVMLNLPLHKAKNVDSKVIDAYTPSLQLGCGVSF